MQLQYEDTVPLGIFLIGFSQNRWKPVQLALVVVAPFGASLSGRGDILIRHLLNNLTLPYRADPEVKLNFLNLIPYTRDKTRTDGYVCI